MNVVVTAHPHRVGGDLHREHLARIAARRAEDCGAFLGGDPPVAESAPEHPGDDRDHDDKMSAKQKMVGEPCGLEVERNRPADHEDDAEEGADEEGEGVLHTPAPTTKSTVDPVDLGA